MNYIWIVLTSIFHETKITQTLAYDWILRWYFVETYLITQKMYLQSLLTFWIILALLWYFKHIYMYFYRKVKINRDLFIMSWNFSYPFYVLSDRSLQKISSKFNHMSTDALFPFHGKSTLKKSYLIYIISNKFKFLWEGSL